MRTYRVEADKYICNISDRYFEINESTKKFLEYYNDRVTIEEIAQKEGIEVDEVSSIYEQISDMIKESNYSDTEDFFSPLSVQWKITNRCNLKCKHCYIGDKCNDSIDKKSIEIIVEKIIKSSVLKLTISGGEALLVDNLDEICEKVISAGIKVKIFTNGYYLVDFLSKLDRRKIRYSDLTICVSVDGLRNVHDNIRGEESFDKLIAGILECKKRGITVITNTVINDYNADDIIDLFQYLHSIGVKEIQCSKLIELGYARKYKIKPVGKEKYVDICNELSKLPFSVKYSTYDGNTIINGEKIEEPDEWKCCAGISKFTILENGNVVLCPFISKTKIGNIVDQDIDEIWNSPNRISARQLIRNNNYGSSKCFIL